MLERMRKENESVKIYQGVFDSHTLKTLTILASKNFFISLDYPIATGKEADVYRLTTREKTYLAAKIYRVETSNFRVMERYLAGDPRFNFKKVSKTRRGTDSIINLWCQKEFRNLRDAHDAGVSVPYPVKNLNNVLLMEFIGKDGVPAPLLKNVMVKKPGELIKKLTHDMELMWKKARIVHGDISEYNIMVLDEKPVLIDIGQAVSTEHPMALELLERDLRNIGKLAGKYGVSFNYSKVLKDIMGEPKDA